MMNREERREKVKELRSRDVSGKFVILRPATNEYAEDIVELRNRPQNRYMFNQSDLITVDGQQEWFDLYQKTENDIYWVVLNKKEEFIGTIRLYGIDLDGGHCEEGSYVIDDEVANEAPYAIEAKMLALDVAFDELQIKDMINVIRVDNKIMNNLANQLGFDAGRDVKIRGVDYLHRVLTVEDYLKNRQKFAIVIDYWSER